MEESGNFADGQTYSNSCTSHFDFSDQFTDYYVNPGWIVFWTLIFITVEVFGNNDIISF